LDGGRVLRSILWRVFEDFERATQWAGRMGILMGNLLTAFGLVIAIVKGSLLSGFFLAFMGWFLSRSARVNTLQSLMATRLRSLRVKDATQVDSTVVDGWDTLAEVLEHAPKVKETGVLVLEEGVPVGALGAADFVAVAPGKYAFHSARNIMTPLQRLVRVSPGESLLNAMRLMEREKVTQLLVDYGGDVFGILSRGSLSRALNSR
jgi:CBS domain-containing protein